MNTLTLRGYLTHTLQQYIDGVLLYSENLYEVRGLDAFDKVTYDSAVVALGGPLARLLQGRRPLVNGRPCRRCRGDDDLNLDLSRVGR